jgi:hypothetical protein
MRLLKRDAGRPVLRHAFAVLLTALVPIAAQAAARLEQVYPALAAANATERAILFTGDDRKAVDTFFRKHAGPNAESKQLPRRDPLLVRDRLPEKAPVRPLPTALDSQLPSLPRGYDRVIVGRDVVLLDLRSQTILDIMREVVR